MCSISLGLPVQVYCHKPAVVVFYDFAYMWKMCNCIMTLKCPIRVRNPRAAWPASTPLNLLWQTPLESCCKHSHRVAVPSLAAVSIPRQSPEVLYSEFGSSGEILFMPLQLHLRNMTHSQRFGCLSSPIDYPEANFLINKQHKSAERAYEMMAIKMNSKRKKTNNIPIWLHQPSKSEEGQFSITETQQGHGRWR